MKKTLTCLLAGLVLFTGSIFAKDFKWSECWSNYGGGIEAGDKVVKFTTGMPWTVFGTFNAGGWAIPGAMAEFEIAQPIWKLPFTFGGYAGFDFYAVPSGAGYNFNHFIITTGGSATYHVQMPVEGLDLYSGTKLGVKADISNAYSNGVNFFFDWGMNIGASYYFNETFGLNMEIGYPYSRLGVVFKI